MTARLLALAVAGAIALSACTGDPPPSSDAPASAAERVPRSATATPSPAPRPRRPEAGACYRLGYDEALAPTTDAEPVPCRRAHTALTYYVGTLRTVVNGHLLAVDAARVRSQVARACPRRLPGFLRTDPVQLRLSMLRAVWFSPSLAQSDEGQDWFRCDVIALAGDGRLSDLEDGLVQTLRTPAGRAAYGVCGTAEPGTPGFERVGCREEHSWRAISSYDLAGSRYPDRSTVRQTAQSRCQAEAKQVADDPLSYRWGYDWPTPEQWRSGQRYGLCWAPDQETRGG